MTTTVLKYYTLIPVSAISGYFFNAFLNLRESKGSNLHVSIIRILLCFQVSIARSFSISSKELLLSHVFIMIAMYQVSAIPLPLLESVGYISILHPEHNSLNS